MQPNQTQILALPIVGTDLVALYRQGDISKPKFLSYAKFLEILQAEISLGANFISSISNTPSINLSVLSGNLTANLTNVGTAGTYGDALNVPQFTVDAQGRITGVTLVPIAAGSGTVSSVGISGAEFVITGSPITTSGVIGLALQPTGVVAGTYGSGTQVPVISVDNKGRITSITTATITGGSGTVTSVGLSMPAPVNPAFSVSGSPVTTNGTLTVTANGNTSQIILGDGSLASISQVVVAARVYQEDTYVSNTQQTSVEYVASVGKVYVTNQSSTNVTIYDATNGDLLATIAGITNALKVKYISSINEVWVTSSTATTIWRIGAVSNTLLGTITTGVTQFGYDILEYSATKVFITCNLNPGSIMVVNPSTLSVTTTITTNVPVFPGGMALNTNVASLQFDKIVVCSSGGVSILDPNTNSISTTLANPSSVFSTGRFIRYSAADDKYYAASRANNRLVVLSIATATTFTATFNSNNLFIMDCAVDDTNDLLFTFPMEGGAVESILVKVYRKSTLTPIVAFRTSCLGGQSSESGFHAIDLLNKRLFVVGRNAQANGAISVIRYL